MLTRLAVGLGIAAPFHKWKFTPESGSPAPKGIQHLLLLFYFNCIIPRRIIKTNKCNQPQKPLPLGNRSSKDWPKASTLSQAPDSHSVY